MKGWQALSWGGRQDSPSGLTPEKETLGEHPPRSAPGPHDFKVESLFDLHLSPGVGGGSSSSHSPGVGLPATSPSCPSECICVEMRGYT